MANQNKTDIGLIGLAVMGENLALNMESKGWNVSVYNRTVPGVAIESTKSFISVNPSMFLPFARPFMKRSTTPSSTPGTVRL